MMNILSKNSEDKGAKVIPESFKNKGAGEVSQQPQANSADKADFLKSKSE